MSLFGNGRVAATTLRRRVLERLGAEPEWTTGDQADDFIRWTATDATTVFQVSDGPDGLPDLGVLRIETPVTTVVADAPDKLQNCNTLNTWATTSRWTIAPRPYHEGEDANAEILALSCEFVVGQHNLADLEAFVAQCAQEQIAAATPNMNSDFAAQFGGDPYYLDSRLPDNWHQASTSAPGSPPSDSGSAAGPGSAADPGSELAALLQRAFIALREEMREEETGAWYSEDPAAFPLVCEMPATWLASEQGDIRWDPDEPSCPPTAVLKASTTTWGDVGPGLLLTLYAAGYVAHTDEVVSQLNRLNERVAGATHWIGAWARHDDNPIYLVFLPATLLAVADIDWPSVLREVLLTFTRQSQLARRVVFDEQILLALDGGTVQPVGLAAARKPHGLAWGETGEGRNPAARYLDLIFGFLVGQDGEWAYPADGGFVWWPYQQAQLIEVTDRGAKGGLQEVVRIRVSTEVRVNVAATDEHLSRIARRNATLPESALVLRPDGTLTLAFQMVITESLEADAEAWLQDLAIRQLIAAQALSAELAALGEPPASVHPIAGPRPTPDTWFTQYQPQAQGDGQGQDPQGSQDPQVPLIAALGGYALPYQITATTAEGGLCYAWRPEHTPATVPADPEIRVCLTPGATEAEPAWIVHSDLPVSGDEAEKARWCNDRNAELLLDPESDYDGIRVGGWGLSATGECTLTSGLLRRIVQGDRRKSAVALAYLLREEQSAVLTALNAAPQTVPEVPLTPAELASGLDSVRAAFIRVLGAAADRPWSLRPLADGVQVTAADLTIEVPVGYGRAQLALVYGTLLTTGPNGGWLALYPLFPDPVIALALEQLEEVGLIWENEDDGWTFDVGPGQAQLELAWVRHADWFDGERGLQIAAIPDDPALDRVAMTIPPAQCAWDIQPAAVDVIAWVVHHLIALVRTAAGEAPEESTAEPVEAATAEPAEAPQAEDIADGLSPDGPDALSPGGPADGRPPAGPPGPAAAPSPEAVPGLDASGLDASGLDASGLDAAAPELAAAPEQETEPEEPEEREEPEQRPRLFGSGRYAASALRARLLDLLNAEPEWLLGEHDEPEIVWNSGLATTVFEVADGPDSAPDLGVLRIYTPVASAGNGNAAREVCAQLNEDTLTARWSVSRERDSDGEYYDEVQVSCAFVIGPHNQDTLESFVLWCVREQIAEATGHIRSGSIAEVVAGGLSRYTGFPAGDERADWNPVTSFEADILAPSSSMSAETLAQEWLEAFRALRQRMFAEGTAAWFALGEEFPFGFEVPFGWGSFPEGVITRMKISDDDDPGDKPPTALVESELVEHESFGNALRIAVHVPIDPRGNPGRAVNDINRIDYAVPGASHTFGGWTISELMSTDGIAPGYHLCLPAAFVESVAHRPLVMQEILLTLVRQALLARRVLVPRSDREPDDEGPVGLAAGAHIFSTTVRGPHGLAWGETGEGRNPAAQVLDQLYDSCVGPDADWAEVRTDGFTWWPYQQAQDITAVLHDASDVVQGVSVRIATEVRRSVPATPAVLRTIALANAELGQSALVLGPDGLLSLTCRLYVHEGTDHWANRWAQWLAAAQFTQARALSARFAPTPNVRADAGFGTDAISAHPFSGLRPEPDELFGISPAEAARAVQAGLTPLVPLFGLCAPYGLPVDLSVADDDGGLDFTWYVSQWHSTLAADAAARVTIRQRDLGDGPGWLVRTVVDVAGSADDKARWVNDRNAELLAAAADADGIDHTTVGGWGLTASGECCLTTWLSPFFVADEVTTAAGLVANLLKYQQDTAWVAIAAHTDQIVPAASRTPQQLASGLTSVLRTFAQLLEYPPGFRWSVEPAEDAVVATLTGPASAAQDDSLGGLSRVTLAAADDSMLRTVLRVPLTHNRPQLGLLYMTFLSWSLTPVRAFGTDLIPGESGNWRYTAPHISAGLGILDDEGLLTWHQTDAAFTFPLTTPTPAEPHPTATPQPPPAPTAAAPTPNAPDAAPGAGAPGTDAAPRTGAQTAPDAATALNAGTGSADASSGPDATGIDAATDPNADSGVDAPAGAGAVAGADAGTGSSAVTDPDVAATGFNAGTGSAAAGSGVDAAAGAGAGTGADAGAGSNVAAGIGAGSGAGAGSGIDAVPGAEAGSGLGAGSRADEETERAWLRFEFLEDFRPYGGTALRLTATIPGADRSALRSHPAGGRLAVPAADQPGAPAHAYAPAANLTGGPIADLASDPIASPTADPAAAPTDDRAADPAAPMSDRAADPAVASLGERTGDPIANSTADPAAPTGDRAADPAAPMGDRAADSAVVPLSDRMGDPAVAPMGERAGDSVVGPLGDPTLLGTWTESSHGLTYAVTLPPADMLFGSESIVAHLITCTARHLIAHTRASVNPRWRGSRG